MKYHNTMISSRRYRAIVTLLALLFLFFQLGTIAHATNYGDNPHEHDGITCVIATINQDDNEILPDPPVLNVPISHVHPEFREQFVSTVFVKQRGRAPPPRGPPQLIH